MNKAIIDLGTNTFNLLIGAIRENKVHISYATKEAVMLGMGGINEGMIAQDAMLRAKETLVQFHKFCQQEGITNILGIATSAMRGAENAQNLVDWAKSELNMEILIISGEEEAQLIYKGVSLLHPFEEEGMIMDIGGGSNEFIHANREEVIRSGSFNIGVSRIYQMLGNPEDFNSKIREQVHQFFEKETEGFFDGYSVRHLVGASGSFETLFEMIYRERFPDDQQMKELPLEEVHRVIHWALNSSLDERMQNEWVIPMRKKMLPIAAYSILWVMEKLGTERITICPYSLKEGAFVD